MMSRLQVSCLIYSLLHSFSYCGLIMYYVGNSASHLFSPNPNCNGNISEALAFSVIHSGSSVLELYISDVRER